MKKCRSVLLALALSVTGAYASHDKKVIDRTYQIDDPEEYHLTLKNIRGDITVEGHSEKTILLSLTISVFGDNDEIISQGMQELDFGEYVSDTALILVMEAPFVRHFWEDGKLEGQWVRQSTEYEFRYDYKLKVPEEIDLTLSTVDQGLVLVKDVTGELITSNVNGSIKVSGAKEVRKAHTVNGNVEVLFNSNPTKNGYFHTINGDITIKAQPGLSADICGDTMNGEMYSAFDFESLPTQVVVDKQKGGRQTTYKLEEKKIAKIGSGEGPDLSFKTLNGNIFIKKI